MRRPVMPLLRLVLVFLAILLSRPTQADAQPSSISGVVTRASDGAPLAGVTVQLYSNNGYSLDTTSSAGDGSYTFAVSAGLYRIFTFSTTNAGTFYLGTAFDNVVCGTGCGPSVGSPVPVAVGQAVANINLPLVAAAELSGTVTRASDGAPISNISIELFRTSWTSPVTTGTNSGGQYTFGALQPGSYFVRTVRSSAYKDELFDNIPCDPSCDITTGTPIIVTAPGVSGIDFVLDVPPVGPGNGSINGVVRSQDTNVALSGVSVAFFDHLGTSVGSTTTVGDGSYTFPLPPGTYFARTMLGNSAAYRNRLYNNLNCSLTCAATSGTPIVVHTSLASPADFYLPPSGLVTGTVTNAVTLNPIAGIRVEAFKPGGSTGIWVNTGTNGTYSLNLLPGTYYIKAIGSSLGYRDEVFNNVGCYDCSITGGEPIGTTDGVVTSGVNFALNPGGQITGTVTEWPSGQLATGAELQLHSSAGKLERSVPIFNGTFAATVVAKSYYVTVSKPGFGTVIFDGVPCPDPCDVTSGTPVDVFQGVTATTNLQLAPVGTVSGVVRDAQTSAPLSQNVRVEIFTTSGALSKTVYPDASGAYSAQLGEGSYRLRARIVGNTPYTNELYNDVPCLADCSTAAGTLVDIVRSATTPNVDFSLTAGGTIGGTVTSAVDGQPLHGMFVSVYRSDGTLAGSTAVSNGVYAIPVPAGTYFAATSTVYSQNLPWLNFAPALYAGQNCLPLCSVTSGTPIAVSEGAGAANINFALHPGGVITGRVTAAATGQPIGLAHIRLYRSDGLFMAQTATSPNGDYGFDSLQAGTYFLRTSLPSGYVDEVYDNQTFCMATCSVTNGAPIVVAAGQAASGIDFSLATAVELLQNGSFDDSTAGWLLHATPHPEFLVSDSTGRFSFTRIAFPGFPNNQAVIFQNTGAALPSGTPIVAQFELGSLVTVSSAHRKRVSVLIHDADFSDLAVCTFWLPAAHAEGTRFGIRMVTTKAWTDATISFYAATATAADERVTLDNVSLRTLPGGSVERTECIDSAGVRTSGGTDSADLLVNGDFSSGTLAPGWGSFGQIQGQVTNGVFEFIKLPGIPAGTVLQPTGQTVDPGAILTATFDLGNSSSVRKRATVILHDNNFSDLAACTFWLDPGQALGTFTMRMTTTKAWTNGTISIYPATTGADQWIRLDNVTLKRTPSAVTTGTTCLEPAGTGGDASGAATGTVSGGTQITAGPDGSPTESTASNAGTPRLSASLPGLSSSTGEGANAGADEDDGDWVSDGFIGDDTTAPPRVWLAVASEHGTLTLTRKATLADDQSTAVRLRSWLRNDRGSRALVQVSGDGLHWETIRDVAASDTWMPVEIDLGAYRGTVTFLRLCFEAAPADAGETDSWRVEID